MCVCVCLSKCLMEIKGKIVTKKVVRILLLLFANDLLIYGGGGNLVFAPLCAQVTCMCTCACRCQYVSQTAFIAFEVE